MSSELFKFVFYFGTLRLVSALLMKLNYIYRCQTRKFFSFSLSFGWKICKMTGSGVVRDCIFR